MLRPMLCLIILRPESHDLKKGTGVAARIEFGNPWGVGHWQWLDMDNPTKTVWCDNSSDTGRESHPAYLPTRDNAPYRA